MAERALVHLVFPDTVHSWQVAVSGAGYTPTDTNRLIATE